MDHGMHSDTKPDNDKAAGINHVKEENVLVKREGLSDSKKVDNGPPPIAGDYSGLGRKLQGLQDAKEEDLPDELRHITDEIVPLGLLLSRLAQFSHSKLQELILSLAAKPLPELITNGNAHGAGSSGVNGNTKGTANAHGPATEDTSAESLDKKAMILNFIQDLHSRWVKALVIAQWSEKADDVGKLIDLRTHLFEKLELYNKAFWDMVNVKHQIAFAKVPSPDLKTALEVLSKGAVHWMPDLGYLPEPPLTAEQKLHWLHELDVTIHMRLQLHEYEHIPQPWKEYEVSNGRVTFTVPGEYEVDLTISEEEFENNQFWFLDFRQTFGPAPPELSERARKFIEDQVNTVLKDEGLPGCHKYLHELTLTTKITELAHQAAALNQSGLWIDTLKVERLNRCLSIQYWAQRSRSKEPASWILIGVHSARPSEGFHDPGTPSHLMLQWFRDGKEVKGVDIPFDVDTISAERLLTAVISRHVEHILSSIYNTLKSKPRYAQKKGSLELQISEQPHAISSLSMQLLGERNAVLHIGTWMGNLYFSEPSPVVVHEWKQRFNSLRNPAIDGPGAMEQIRWSYTTRCLRRLPKSTQWAVLPQTPIPLDEVKRVLNMHVPPSREAFHMVWVRHAHWHPHWYAMMSLSLGGDHWWLIQGSADGHDLSGFQIKSFTELPITPNDLLLPSNNVFDSIAKYATNVMAEIEPNGLNLQRAPVADKARDDIGSVTTHVRSADLRGPGSTTSHWATQIVQLKYLGPAPMTIPQFKALIESHGSLQRPPPPLRVIAEATVGVKNRANFDLFPSMLDRMVSYDHRRGMFTLGFRAEVSSGVIPQLRERMEELDRLVDIVDALRRGGKHVVAENITLRNITFTYDSAPAVLPPNQLPTANQDAQPPYKVQLVLAKDKDVGVKVVLERGNPHLRVIDYLRDAANSPTFGKLPAWFIFTLPLFRALERMQDAWDPVLAKGQGACYIFHKSLDWVTIRFAISGAQARRVNLDIQPADKEGNLMWHIHRSTTDANASNENDEFNKMLKQRVWSASGNGFKGLVNGAAATWDSGIESLLTLISESVLALVGTPAPPQSQQAQHAQQMQRAQSQQQRQHPQAPPHEHQQPIPPQGGPQAKYPHQLQQPQQGFQHHQQQGRVSQQQHMPQPNMVGQGQGQGQQQRASVGKSSNAPVVVLD